MSKTYSREYQTEMHTKLKKTKRPLKQKFTKDELLDSWQDVIASFRKKGWSDEEIVLAINQEANTKLINHDDLKRFYERAGWKTECEADASPKPNTKEKQTDTAKKETEQKEEVTETETKEEKTDKKNEEFEETQEEEAK